MGMSLRNVCTVLRGVLQTDPTWKRSTLRALTMHCEKRQIATSLLRESHKEVGVLNAAAFVLGLNVLQKIVLTWIPVVCNMVLLCQVLQDCRALWQHIVICLLQQSKRNRSDIHWHMQKAEQ